MSVIKKVIVVGGGIGGLTVGHALARNGISTRIVEISDRSERLGTGITLLGNALRALDKLDLVDACLEGGKGWDTITMRDPAGGTIAEIASPRVWSQDRPGALGIMRPVLGQILEDNAIKSGADLDFNIHITAIEQDDDGVTVTLSDGTTDRADLLIAADGVYSKTREMVFGEKLQPKFVGQGVWRYTVPINEAFQGFSLYKANDGPALGSLPLSDELCYLFFLENSKEKLRVPKSEIHDHVSNFLERFSAPEIVEAKEEISSDRHISYRPFDALIVENSWHRGRVVLIGDAAHSLTPQMTSGGGMAIEDALVLTEEIEAGGEMESILSRYFERRFSRVKKVFDVGYAICVEEQNPKHGPEYAMGLLKEGHKFLAGQA